MSVKLALIGAGRIGSNHARLITNHVIGSELVAVVDPTPNAETLADELGAVAFSNQMMS